MTEFEGRAFAETFFNKTPMKLDYATVPSAVFSQPPVAVVGLTEGLARKDHKVRIFISRFKPMKPTRACGMSCKMESNIPRPARKIGTSATSRSS